MSVLFNKQGSTMHQSVSFYSFVFILIERTKDAIITASTLLQDLILEAGKRMQSVSYL